MLQLRILVCEALVSCNKRVPYVEKWLLHFLEKFQIILGAIGYVYLAH